ncbi:hypothetical protein CEXT_584241 [Caerostris extrusa]|uniref:Uncharacterized protein n=1 Tax=Caerostris extrusa TaxID=172846 RepID=A0AAV4T233_CAEEX|nr:hypothetical protein CEXT_584241 [Caerostris extrusa]
MRCVAYRRKVPPRGRVQDSYAPLSPPTFSRIDSVDRLSRIGRELLPFYLLCLSPVLPQRKLTCPKIPPFFFPNPGGRGIPPICHGGHTHTLLQWGGKGVSGEEEFTPSPLSFRSREWGVQKTLTWMTSTEWTGGTRKFFLELSRG